VVDFGLLGPLSIIGDEGPIDLGAAQQRALLICLLLNVGRSVPIDRLIDSLWEEDPPRQARVTLRSYVSNLRRALDGSGVGSIIVTRANGYGIEVDPGTVDAVRFERRVQAGRERLAAGDPEGARHDLDEALALWRGEALADVADRAFAQGERTRLEELRRGAQEDRFEALLASGRHVEVIGSLEAFTAAHPLRERARGQLMLALYRSDRTPDALRSFAKFREAMVEELGLDPGPVLSALADDILRRSDRLAAPVRPEPTSDAAARPASLIGRTHELVELQGAVDRVVAGRGELVLIAGEPGIGKTAVLEELARIAGSAGFAVSWGRCHEVGGAPAYWPWVQVMREVARQHSDDELRRLASDVAAPVTQLVPEIAGRLGHQHVVVGDDLEEARFELYDAVTTFLLRASALRSLLVLLDDLHWADAPSLELLSFLAPHLRAAGILVAGSYRDVRSELTAELEATLATVVRDGATRQFDLVGLQPDAVVALAETFTGHPIEHEEAEHLHERTGGNPFFVTQLASLMREARPRPSEQVDIPTGVRHVIAQRVSALPDPTRGLLDAASVMGRNLTVRRLAAITRLSAEAVLSAATDAVAAGLLEPEDRPVTAYRFVHALVRETIYDALDGVTVARLHADVGSALELSTDVQASELAEHFWNAAEIVGDDRPVRYLVSAADEALAVVAYEQAERYLQRALDLCRSGGAGTTELELRVRLLQLSISIHGWSSDLVQEIASPAIGTARSVGLQPGVLPSWVALLSAYTSHGEHETAKLLADELLDLGVAAGSPGARTAGHLGHAYIELLAGGDPVVVLEHLDHAETFAALAPAEDLRATPHLGVATRYLRAAALAYRGESGPALDTARDATDLASEVADTMSRAIAHMIAALVGVVAGDPVFAAETAEAGMQLCDRHGYRYVGQQTAISHAWARARLGDDPAQRADEMAATLEGLGRLSEVDPGAKARLFTAETYLLAGDVQRASNQLEAARALSRRTGEYLPEDRLQAILEQLPAATDLS
jgi:DNA-binding SARP family transcriptional activator